MSGKVAEQRSGVPLYGYGVRIDLCANEDETAHNASVQKQCCRNLSGSQGVVVEFEPTTRFGAN